MPLETHHATIEAILDAWRARLGRQYEAYRGHVYRVYNYCLQLRPCTDDEKAKLAIASCFHDIGIWSDATLDYLAPSVAHANTHLALAGREEWREEVALMIELHHQPSPYRDERHPLVEVFRKADLIDLSLGLFRFGLSREQVRQVKTQLPNAGFHRFLLGHWLGWLLRHPFNPLPFVRW